MSAVLGALLLASVTAGGEKPVTRLSVTLPECGEGWLLTDSLMERLRLELAPLGLTEVSTVPLSGEAAFSNDLLVIESTGCTQQALLKLYLPPFTQVFRRSVSLAGLTPLERSRLLAFVVAELFAVAPRDAAAVPTVESGVTELPRLRLLPVAPAGKESVVKPTLSPWAGYVTLGATAAPSVRVGLVNAFLGGSYEVSPVVRLEGGLRGGFGVNQTDIGGAETALVAAELGASLFNRTDQRWLLSAGLHLQVGWLNVRGIAGSIEIMGAERSVATVVPAVVAALEAPVGETVNLRFEAEAGLVAVGLEARANGIPAGGLTGATVGLSAGVSFQ